MIGTLFCYDLQVFISGIKHMKLCLNITLMQDAADWQLLLDAEHCSQ